MLVYYFVPFIVSNRYLLFLVSNGHNSVTVQNRTHVYTNFFHYKDLGNHLLQLCPKVVKHCLHVRPSGESLWPSCWMKVASPAVRDGWDVIQIHIWRNRVLVICSGRRPIAILMDWRPWVPSMPSALQDTEDSGVAGDVALCRLVE